MSGYAPDGTPARKDRDPLLRFLGGCAIVAGALVALVVIVVGIGGWLLVRDTTPAGRSEEPFLLAGDTAYWRFDLRPDDPGLRVLLEHVRDTAERAGAESAPGSPIAQLRIRRRDADLDRILPMTVEVADSPRGWAARFTMSKQVLRLRAALRIMRWIVTRDSRQAKNEEVDGVTMTTLRPHGTPVAAFAMVGPRLSIARDPDRLRSVLSRNPSPDVAREPEGIGARTPSDLESAHDAVRREDEIGWGFRQALAIPRGDAAACVFRASASFVLAADGKLHVAVRAVGRDGPPCHVRPLDTAAARTIVAALVPGIAPESIVVAEGSPRRTSPDAWAIEATIPDFGKQLEAAFARFTARHAAEGAADATASPGSEPPSATPRPPSPGTTSGPRSGTPAAPPRAGTPTPPR